MDDILIVTWIVLFSISITLNIISGFEIYKYRKNFTGTLQECWDKGGEAFYADKEYGTISCTGEKPTYKIEN